MFEVMTGAGAQLDQDVVKQLLGQRRITLEHSGNSLKFRVVRRRQANFARVATQFQ